MSLELEVVKSASVLSTFESNVIYADNLEQAINYLNPKNPFVF